MVAGGVIGGFCEGLALDTGGFGADFLIGGVGRGDDCFGIVFSPDAVAEETAAGDVVAAAFEAGEVGLDCK